MIRHMVLTFFDQMTRCSVGLFPFPLLYIIRVSLNYFRFILNYLKDKQYIMSMKCDNCGKIYVLTNPDYPSDYYIGSTTQTYLAKRYYRHKQEYAKGSKSYGNIFKSDNHEIRAIEWHSNISVKDLCIRERFYIDYYKALGNNVNNQRMPHSSLEEISSLIAIRQVGTSAYLLIYSASLITCDLSV